jgi:hypothetical protein
MDVKLKLGDEYFYIIMCDNVFCKIVPIKEWTGRFNQIEAAKWFSKRHAKETVI